MKHLFCRVLIAVFVVGSACPLAEGADRGRQYEKKWHSKIWTREEDKHILREGDMVTVTPGDHSFYPTLVLKVPSKERVNATIYFWEAVRLYARDEPEKALDRMKKASLTEPYMKDLKQAHMAIADAHELVTRAMK